MEPLLTGEEVIDVAARAWTTEGDALVIERRIQSVGLPQSDIAILSMEGEPTVEMLLDSEFSESRATLSPNGRWIAYDSNRSGRIEVYVERFPELGDREPISTEGGRRPRWSPDGDELFYVTLDNARLMVVPVTTEADFSAGSPDTLVEGQFLHLGGRPTYDVTSDGRLVSIQRGADPTENDSLPQIILVQNWFEELKRLVPTN